MTSQNKAEFISSAEQIQNNSVDNSIKKSSGFKMELLDGGSTVKIGADKFNILNKTQDHQNEKDVQEWLKNMVAGGEEGAVHKESNVNAEGVMDLAHFGVAAVKGELAEEAVSYGIEHTVLDNGKDGVEKRLIEKEHQAERAIAESKVAGQLIMAITTLARAHQGAIFEVENNRKNSKIPESAKCLAVTKSALEFIEKETGDVKKEPILNDEKEQIGTEYKLDVDGKEIKIVFLIAKPEEEREVKNTENEKTSADHQETEQ